MRKELTSILRKMEVYPRHVRDAIMEAQSDTEMIDVIGTIKENERRYRADVSAAVAEHAPDVDGVIQGERHRVEVGRQAARSYNTPNLMKKMQDEGITFMDLIDQGVIEVKWRWTELSNFTKRRGIELKIEPREVSSLGKEDADVGEIWGSTYPKWS